MLNKQDKVVKLCLKSFPSRNIIHFQLERRNSNWNCTRFEQSRIFFLCSTQL